MIVTCAGFKGGVGKTTTAVHLAGYFHGKGSTVLIDGDPNRAATSWSKRGGFPFPVIDERQAARFARDYKHAIIDTAARPGEDDMRALAEGCDLLVLPATPDALSLEALVLTVNALKAFNADRFKVLLTIVPPAPSRDGEEARATLRAQGLPMFRAEIRRAVALQKAALAGRLVTEVHDPRAERAWHDYQHVGKEIL